MNNAEIILAAVKRHPKPITSAELALMHEDMNQQAISSAVGYLLTTGALVRAGKVDLPDSLRRRGSPKQAWAYRAAETPPRGIDVELARLLKDEALPVDTGEIVQTAPDPVDLASAGVSEIASALIDRQLAARADAEEDPADPECALDSAWPDALEERPAPRDPLLAEIEREARAICPRVHDAERIVARLKAGLPFVADRMPVYGGVITEACAALLEMAA